MGLRIWVKASGVTKTLEALRNFVGLGPHLVSPKSLVAPLSLKSLGTLGSCSSPSLCLLRHWERPIDGATPVVVLLSNQPLQTFL